MGVVAYLIAVGVGIWGIGIPVAWGFAITSFVWWIGIGHAGTLISAILAADAPEMAHVDQPPGRGHDDFRRHVRRRLSAASPRPAVVLLLAVALRQYDGPLAAVPQRLALGRFRRQHLFHGVAAVLVHGHDPRSGHPARPRYQQLARVGYGVWRMGWRNSARHWERYEAAYLLLAGLATPLVVSVHSVVSSDFAMSNLPGWHETVFPPYFVAGAIFSGFAMVLVLSIILSQVFTISKPSLPIDHLDVMGKVCAGDQFSDFLWLLQRTVYGLVRRDKVERYLYTYRLIGFDQFAVESWIIFFCNMIVPQVLWFEARALQPAGVADRCRIIVLIGMWLERYMIITTTLSRDFLPSSWGMFEPTVWDYLTYFGIDRSVFGDVVVVHPPGAADFHLGTARHGCPEREHTGRADDAADPLLRLVSRVRDAAGRPESDAPRQARWLPRSWTPIRLIR